MDYKLASIMLSSQNANSIGEIFIAQVDSDKENLAGKLFVLLEIENNHDALKIIDFLVNNINHNYYNNEKIILRERIQNLKIEHIFEASLAKTNKDFFEFLEREKISLTSKNFNATIGIIDENELHFSNVGKNKATLIHKHKEEIKRNKQRTGEIKISYKAINVDNESKHKRFDKEKIFSNVVSGVIPKGGYFLFTNEALPEYLSNKQLIDIITKLQPAGAAEQIKNTLSTINAYVSFLGIIIKNSHGLLSEDELSKPQENTGAQDSIAELNIAEEETERLLTPTGSINSRKWANLYSQIISKIKPRLQKEKNKALLIKDRIFVKRKPSFINLKKIKNFFILLFSYFLASLRYFFSIISNPQTRRELFKKFSNIYIWFKKLNKKHKILLTASVLFLILFFSSLSITNKNNEKQAELEKISKLATLIEQKQNQTDAHLLYSNEKKAKTILDEVKKLLEELKLNFEEGENIEEYQKYFEKYQNQIDKISRVVKVETANLADFSNLNKNAKVENIILVDNKIYVGDTKENTVYKLNLGDNLVTAITSLSSGINSFKKPVVDKNKNIYYLNESKQILLNTASENFSSFDLDRPRVMTATEGFNNRMYILDAQENQIFKYDNSANGFTGKRAWISGNADLSGAVDFSIDGHIYILKKNGEILKYLKGEEKELKLDPVEPALNNAKKIIVSEDLEFIYILENNRLVIFNKAGNFLTQYASNNFNDLKDFAVDEVNKKLYVLNGALVYVFEGEHF